ncbi:MAG TPA: hypothetical protein VNA11_11865 [Pseudonocardia sp.]|nr:hypothetical protein [Pseudonocardia sp.]
MVPGRGPVAESGRTPYAEPAGRATPHPGTQPPLGYSTRPGTPGLYPPMFGLGPVGADHEHRRPDYLLDDGGAFVDDRWFPPPVIGPDDGPPAPPRWTA